MPDYTNPQGISVNGTASDTTRLWQEVHDRVVQALPGIGRDAAESIAQKLANGVVGQYENEIKKGTAPGVALQVAQSWEKTWTEQAQKANNVTAPTPSSAPGTGGQVDDTDRARALDQYRTGIDKGKSVYQGIVDNPVNDPNARDTFKPVEAQKTGTMFVADPRVNQAATVVAPDKPITATASAAGTLKTTDAVAAGAIDPALLTPAQRLQAATQAATNVQGTRLDTGQADESRTAATQALEALQATSRGEGQAQVRSDAQLKLDLAKAAAAAAGNARSARGSERKGALIQSTLQAGEQGAQAVAANAAKNADIALAAQQTVGTQAQGNRAQDLAQAAKRADLESQQKTLQAQLDAARAAGDAGREQDIRTKMADLDQQVAALNASAKNTANEAAAGRTTAVSLSNATEKNKAGEAGAGRMAEASRFNAGAYNTTNDQDAARRLAAATTNAQTKTTVDQNNVENRTKVALANQAADQSTQQFNSSQGVQVGVANNAGGLAANVAGSNQDIAQAKLRMDAQDAIERSSQGLLTESERQAQLAIARQQLQIAQQRGDREAEQSWFDKISALVTTVGTVAKVVAPAAAVASDIRLKTNIKKASAEDLGELARALRDSASTWDYRTDKAPDLPEGTQTGFMAHAIQGTKLGKGLVSKRDDGYLQVDVGDLAKMAALLAAHNITEKKGRAA